MKPIKDRSWIARNLSAEEQQQLIADLLNLSASPTGEEIRELVMELKGNAPSVNSCLEWKKNTLAFHLAELREQKHMAEGITSLVADGMSLSDAAAAKLCQFILDRVLYADELDDKAINKLTLALARLRKGDQRAKEWEHKRTMDEFNASRAALAYLSELKAIHSDSGLSSDEKINAVRRRLFGDAHVKATEDQQS